MSNSHSHWLLRPGDLPPPHLADHPHFGDLAHNPVFRLLIHYDHRTRLQRRLLVFGLGPSILLFSWIYLEVVFALPRDFAGAGALGITTCILLLVANIFALAGIEGYETNGNLRHRFFDIIATGIPPEEIARGIWGKTVTRYPVRRLRLELLGASLVLVFLIAFFFRTSGYGLAGWMLLVGVWAAFNLYAALDHLDWITLPGTLLWYRAVRRGYERRLAEVEGRPPSFFANAFRAAVFLIVSLAVVLVPLGLYAWIGAWLLPLLFNAYGPTAGWMFSACVLAAASGLVTGWLYGRWARATGPRRFERFVATLDRLFTIRSWVLLGD